MLIRALSRRDASALLIGASCFYIFSAFVTRSRVDINATHSFGANTHPQAPNNLNAGETYQTVTTTTTYVSPAPTQTIPLDLGLAQDFPETSVVAHAPGWTIFQNLYMSGGTLLLLTSDSAPFPEHRLMTSTGLPGNVTNDPQRMPTAHEMAFITPEEARLKWGADSSSGGRHRVRTVEGTTLLFNDPPQFLNHYFHFVAELMFGSWAFFYGAFFDGLVKPPSDISPEPSFNLPFISTSTPKIDRVIFIHSDVDGWRDKPGFNGYFLRAVFPSVTVEVSTDWDDRVNATSNAEIGRAWHFPLVLLADRSAAFRSTICGQYTQRTAAAAWTMMAKQGKIDLIGNWWSSMRAALLRYAGGDPHEELHSVLQVPETIVITYINRQGTRRHLRDEDNSALVAAIEELVARKNREGKKWEFHNVHAERLSLDEQVKYAGRTTILLGVHGNGLTHLVLMKPNRVSAVLEMFFPGGFARDYEWTSRSLGMTHYSIWNDTSFTHPHEPEWPAYPEGFQGPNIPVSGAFVADLIDKHVTSRSQRPSSVDTSPAHDVHDERRSLPFSSHLA